jgi:predicted RNase H-like nuclease
MLDPKVLVEHAAAMLGGHDVTCVAVDMPLARGPITSRRAADDAVASAFGAMWCGTHSPTATRPGAISELVRQRCEEAGFRLATDRDGTEPRALIEVYPHPAIVRLCGLSRRAPYKVSRRRSYWPDVPNPERLRRLLVEWQQMVACLEREVAAIAEHFRVPPPEARPRTLKGHEDALDALICAWVGVCYLEGRAQPFGDGDAAIWVPTQAEVTASPTASPRSARRSGAAPDGDTTASRGSADCRAAPASPAGSSCRSGSRDP